MPDKKLTDSEIVKALECCGCSANVCDDCPITTALKDDCKCGEYLATNALDLINRLQAENERVETLNSDLVEIQDIRKKVNLALIAENAELTTAYKTAKAEAYKEFAERLKTEYAKGMNWFKKKESYYVDVGDIDNLLKELVGENDAR